MKTLFKEYVCGLALALAGSIAAHAADIFPTRPVRIIVPSAPGATVDIATRLVGLKMSEKLGQPVVVENRAGASGQMGVRYVKNQSADGYNLMSTSNSITARAVDVNADVDLLRDFTGVGQMVRSPYMMVVATKQPIRTVAEFIAVAKARPGELSFASGGPGSAGHLAAAKFLTRFGLKEGADILHVPYKGGGPARVDVIAGNVTVLFTGVSSAAGDVRSGLLRTLGITSASRLPMFPDIPTIAEQGLPKYSDYVWVGLFAPARTPRVAIQRLADAMQSSTRELREIFERDGSEIVVMAPDEFNKSLRQEVSEMVRLSKILGLKLD